MKKFFIILLSLVLCLLSLSCGNQDDDKIKVGTIKYLNVSEDVLDKLSSAPNHDNGTSNGANR